MLIRQAGSSLAHSLELPNLRERRVLLGRLERPEAVHVYSAECYAGERLRVQVMAPALPLGGGLAPSFAIVAQGLPYSADAHKLPLALPAGYSAVVAPTPGTLAMPVRDMLTRAKFYPGSVVDTRTLVGGRCYIVVWSPSHTMGKYMLQVGTAWPWYWMYWLQLPFYWWQIRGWFGLSRAAGYAAGAGALALALLLLRAQRGRASHWNYAEGEAEGNEGPDDRMTR
jgi:hypothetical protein